MLKHVINYGMVLFIIPFLPSYIFPERYVPGNFILCPQQDFIKGGFVLLRDYKSIPLWQDVTQEQWNDWRWQITHRITTNL